MLDLTFHIEAAEALAQTATPQLCFKLHVEAAANCQSLPIQSVMLRVQIRIEPTRRGYSQEFAAGLCDLFGERERWGGTMRSMLWTHANILVPSFVGATLVDLPIECTFDFNVAATKYFDALEDGDVPLCFLFSGTCFYQAESGLQAAPISWEREANFQLPVQTWKDMMAQHYRGRAWLCVQQDSFARLHAFKTRHALPTWEQAIDRLLANSVENAVVER